MAIYISTKTYSFVDGLSCCYRQWQTTTYKSRLHGHALGFKLVFECHHLDDNGQIMDFTLLDPIDTWIKTQFDHTVAIAQDDPKLAIFQAMNDQGLCDLRVLPGTGCAKFAEHVFQHVKQWMTDQGLLTRVTIRSVECSEHEGNTFMYIE